eukprot:TRINITY_DN3780_c0_g4_i2.p1 TRINITY_DN3780_c0_g4~~TRINITY_DN3780_c0_g4_i2.p1  ORF type:complete len:580 (+),score=55.17 TRINITY_DN3780_c0_g4_i2:55-1794(+)
MPHANDCKLAVGQHKPRALELGRGDKVACPLRLQDISASADAGLLDADAFELFLSSTMLDAQRAILAEYKRLLTPCLSIEEPPQEVHKLRFSDDSNKLDVNAASSPCSSPCGASPRVDLVEPAVTESKMSESVVACSACAERTNSHDSSHSEHLLFLDMVPAAVIVMNAIAIGLGTDFHPESIVWDVLEVCFTLFFMIEFCLKTWYFGCRSYWTGKDWYWNWFDFLCLVLAVTDTVVMVIAYSYVMIYGSNSATDLGAFMQIKLLRLARLARIIRLLRFKVFRELKELVQGVIAGVRVLLWAVVALILVIFTLGIAFRQLVSGFSEFDSLASCMFTLFRCFTDGCAAIDGTPLTEKLRAKYGIPFVFTYSTIFLFVHFGLFNLIMALYVDYVVHTRIKHEAIELGQLTHTHEKKIRTAIKDLYYGKKKETGLEATLHDLRAARNSIVRFGVLPNFDVNQIESEHFSDTLFVTKDKFNSWLNKSEFLSMLDDVNVDQSTKAELFDVLDTDLSGELAMEELVEGLMKLRGNTTKNDIVGVRMQVQLLTRRVEKLMNAMDSVHQSVSTCVTGLDRVSSFVSS